MDYKKLIKSRKTRVRIMQALSFVPDSIMVKMQYKLKTGHRLNLKNPERFTEKLQWYKLYYRNELMAQCADKYEVRKYVEQCGLGSILNKLYGVYDSPKKIDFNKLPKSFVIKDTLGGGGNAVILVEDKSKIDEAAVRRQMAEWVNEPVHEKHPGREWVYDGKKHRIIIEELIPSNPETGGLIDYKFFCFNGKAEYLYVIADRKVGDKAGFGIFDADYNRLNVIRADEKPLTRKINKPKNYDELKQAAEILAKPFPEVRIDFYNEGNQIRFGEITFFDGSGYMTFEPDEFDYIFGEKFDIQGLYK
ncbi:MAG: carbonic anhydrase [Butyrivibrio sp.]|nr:carbonic anhydrase [Butyrivibrio sp.]